jgi:hypothetical protein
MRKFSIAIAVLLSAFLFITTSCNRKTNCSGAICTEIFVSVSVLVTNSADEAVMLDEVYTVRDKTGERIDVAQGMGEGYYAVLTDNYRSQIRNSTETFTFIGIKDGQQVVNEKYSISADCCHIDKRSGKDIIIVP